MYEFLTLAIREKDPRFPNDFEIVVMDKRTKNLYGLTLSKENIINGNQIFWDIGYVTTVKDVANKDGEMRPVGFINIKDASKDLKNILDKKANDNRNFFKDKDIKFGVLKVNKTKNISIGEYTNKRYESIFQTRMNVDVNGVVIPNSEDGLLNKDYRWVKYWQHIYEITDDYEQDEKLDQYQKLLNSANKTLYLIMYRHTFHSGRKQHWIAGMHLL